MNGSKIQLGGMLSVPSQFEPTEQFADRLYLYRVDWKRGICKLTILSDRATRPAGYYAVGPKAAPAAPVATHPDQTELVMAQAPRTDEQTNKRKTLSVQLPTISMPALPKVNMPSFTRPPKVKPAKVKTPRLKRRFTKPHTGVRRSVVAVASMAATAAAFLLLYPMYPQIQYSVATLTPAANAVNAVAETPVSNGNELRIPKIGVRTAILESDSLEILNKKEGVWHQSGTLGVDNFVLAGHRWKYLPPNTATFYNLNKLVEGDTIVIDWFKKRYLFTVRQTLTVSQDRTDLIQPTSQPRITLYTCNDKEETQRVVVIAELEQ